MRVAIGTEEGISEPVRAVGWSTGGGSVTYYMGEEAMVTIHPPAFSHTDGKYRCVSEVEWHV